MSGTRKLAAILAADVVGYSRLAGADEERTLARLRALRGDLIDPAIAAHHGRVVKRTGDGTLVEFRSVVDAVRCAVEMQSGMVERNAGVATERAIRFRVGIHLGDVVEEDDGDLMGDGVNIAARLEGIAEPDGICLSAIAYESVRDKVEASFADLGERELKNIVRPVRVYSVTSIFPPSPPLGGGEGRDEVGDSRARTTTSPSRAVGAGPSLSATRRGDNGAPRLSIVVLPFANIGGDPEQDYFVDGVTESLTTDLSRIAGSFVIARNTAFTYKGKPVDVKQIRRELNVRYVLEGSVQKGGNRLRVNAAHRCRDRQPPVGRTVRQARRRSFRHAGRNRLPPRQPTQRAAHRRRGTPRGNRAASRFDGSLFPGHGLGQQGREPGELPARP
jgi:adenylate cyclase